MTTGLVVFGFSVVISAFFLWTNRNGEKRDREREWGK